MSDSLLAINGIAFQSGSARSIRQTLELIENGQMRRDVNGTLVDLTRSTGRKFRISLSCQDQHTPGFFGLWRGSQVVVDSIKTLTETTDQQSIDVLRDPVPGSVQAYTADWTDIPVLSISGRTVSLDTFAGLAIVEYRPRLTMRVMSLSTDEDEWGAVVGWNCELEEV